MTLCCVLLSVSDDAFWAEDVYVIEFQQHEDYKLNTPGTYIYIYI